MFYKFEKWRGLKLYWSQPLWGVHPSWLPFHSDVQVLHFLLEGEVSGRFSCKHVRVGGWDAAWAGGLMIWVGCSGNTSSMGTRYQERWEVSSWAQHAGSAGVNKGPESCSLSMSLMCPVGEVVRDNLYLLTMTRNRNILCGA